MDKRENKKIKKQKVSETRDLENETNNKIIEKEIRKNNNKKNQNKAQFMS